MQRTVSVSSHDDSASADRIKEGFEAMQYLHGAQYSSSQPRERAQLAEQLRADARTLETKLRHTQRRINQLSPIGSLAPETLGIVFSFFSELEQPRAFNQCTSGSLGWLRLMHVCNAWRNVCISTPQLWANSLGRLPRALPVFLKRAGEHTPLRFHLSDNWDTWIAGYSCTADCADYRPDMVNVTTELLLRSRRIVDLELHLPMSGVGTTIGETLREYDFGALTHLRLETAVVGGSRTLMRASLVSHMLRTADFGGSFIPIIAPSLTFLSLKNIFGGLDGNMLHDVIRASPCLEAIILIDLPRGVLKEKPERQAVSLHRLVYLRISLTATGEEINTFVRKLKTPRTVQMDVCWCFKPLNMADHEAVHSIFKATYLEREETALEIKKDSIELRTSFCRGRWQQLKLSITLGNNGSADILRDACLGPYLEKVVHLTVSSVFYAAVDEWAQIFALLPSVDTLELSVCRSSLRPLSLEHIFHALARCFVEDKSFPTLIPLPKLSTLTLNTTIDASTISIRNEILPCLSLRAFAEANSLRTICLEGFEAIPSLDRQLREVVGAVAWKDT
ncbi:unnamed protein product [Peniophora sp. CBMAI 1063]|nr:unnamed protein product [Peniophora sp. CBMAI 1063]